MGVQERRAREKEALRRKILDAASELILSGGFESFSLRQVAERIEYSPSSIYLYFKSKDELIGAICAETFDGLIERLGAIPETLPPLEGLEAGIRAYIVFGLDHPIPYQLIFSSPGQPEEDSVPEARERGLRAFAYLTESIGRCVASGDIRSDDIAGDCLVAWMAMHGVTSLLISDHGKWGLPWPGREALIDRGVRLILRGLRG